MTTHVPVLMVGAGISGLVCAYALRQSGVGVLVLESSSRPGGLIRSERRDGYLLELGPQSFTGTPPLLRLCRDLKIESELLTAPPRAPRFLLIDGQLKPAPLPPAAFFVSSLFSLHTKWSLLRDALGRTTPPEADESIASFTRRKFTPELLDKLVGPFISGVYAGDPEKLSLRSAFPQLHEAERAYGSVIRGLLRASKSQPKSADAKQRPALQSFRDGNETLVRALAAALGSSLRTNAEVTSLQHGGAGRPQASASVVTVKSAAGSESLVADHLVLATPPHITAKLLATAPEKMENRLSEIEFAPVAVVSLGYSQAAVGRSLDGFGFLIPRSACLRTLGVVWNSSLFPGRAPVGQALVTGFVGGATDPDAVTLPQGDLAALVHREIAPILRIHEEPVFSNVTAYSHALPQYTLGHLDRLTKPSEFGFPCSNLWLVGNYLRGPSIGACIEEALRVAAEIRAQAPRQAGASA